MMGPNRRQLSKRIDRRADEEEGVRHDGYLQGALRRQPDWPNRVAMDAALDRGRAALKDLGSFESADLIRAEREKVRPTPFLN